MTTGQKYVGKANNALENPSAAQNTAPTPSTGDSRQPGLYLISAEEFVTNNADRFSNQPGLQAGQITEQLALTPVHYDNVLDAITLLRGMLPESTGVGHYALLFQKQRIIGWAYLPVSLELYDIAGRLGHMDGRVSTLAIHARELMQTILTMNIDRVVFATTRLDHEYLFDEDELRSIDHMHTSLEMFGVELLEWLLLYPDANVSRAWAEYEEDGLDDGVTVEMIEDWGIKSDQQASR